MNPHLMWIPLVVRACGLLLAIRLRFRCVSAWVAAVWLCSFGAHLLLCVAVVIDRRMSDLAFSLFYLYMWFLLGILLQHQPREHQARFPHSMLLRLDPFYSEWIYTTLLIGTACIIAGIQQVCLFLNIGTTFFAVCVFASLAIYACLLYVQVRTRVPKTALEQRATLLFVGTLVILTFYTIEHMTMAFVGHGDVRHPLTTSIVLLAMDVLIVFRFMPTTTTSRNTTATWAPQLVTSDAEMEEIWHIHRQLGGMQQLHRAYDRLSGTVAVADPWATRIYPNRHSTIPGWMNRDMFAPIRQQPFFVWDVAITPAELWVFLTETQTHTNHNNNQREPFISIFPVFRVVSTNADRQYDNDKDYDDLDGVTVQVDDLVSDQNTPENDADTDQDKEVEEEENDEMKNNDAATSSNHDWIYTAELPSNDDLPALQYFMCRLLDTIGHLAPRSPRLAHRTCWDMLRQCVLSLSSLQTLPFYVQSYVRFRSRCIRWRGKCAYDLLQCEPHCVARAHAMRCMLSITAHNLVHRIPSLTHHLIAMERIGKLRVIDTSSAAAAAFPVAKMAADVARCWNHITRRHPADHEPLPSSLGHTDCCTHTDERICLLVVDAYMTTTLPHLYARWSCSGVWSSMSVPLVDAVRLLLVQHESSSSSHQTSTSEMVARVDLVGNWFAVIHRHPNDTQIQLAHWNSQHLDQMVPWLHAAWRFGGPLDDTTTTSASAISSFSHRASVRATPWYRFLWRMHMQNNFGCRRFLRLLMQAMPPATSIPSESPSEIVSMWHQCRRFSMGVLCTITDADAGKLPLYHFFRRRAIDPTWSVSCIVARMKYEQDTCTDDELAEWKVYLVQICWTIYVHNMGDISLRDAWIKHTLPQAEEALYILAYSHNHIQSSSSSSSSAAAAARDVHNDAVVTHKRSLSEFAIMSADFYQ